MIMVDIHTLQLEQIIYVMKSLIAFIRAKTLNSVWINFITHFRFILLKIVMRTVQKVGTIHYPISIQYQHHTLTLLTQW